MNKANLKTLIRYKNYLQNLSTLFLQGAFFGLIKTPGLSGGPKSFSGVIMKKQASLVIIRMWSANYIERTKEVLSWDIPMTYTVYHIRNGTVSIISFSHQNKEERHSMSQGGLMSAECYGSYANGNM